MIQRRNYIWIKLGCEQDPDLESLTFPIHPQDNYTITDIQLSPKFDLKVLPYLKAVESVRFIKIVGTELKLLASGIPQPLGVKRVSLIIKSASGMLLQEDLPRILVLDGITTLELVVLESPQLSSTMFQFQWLLQILPKLKHLSYICDPWDTLNQALRVLKGDTINSLILCTYWPLRVPEFTWMQEKSIQRFSLVIYSDNFDVDINDFDHICKPIEKDVPSRFRYQNFISQFLGGDIEKFPCLNHVIISKCHYKVERGRNVGFQVVPMNY